MKFVLVVLLSVLTVAAQADKSNIGRNVTVKLPGAVARTDNIWIEVKIGALVNRAEIEVWTADHQFLGIISPFAPGSFNKNATATYILPVPGNNISGGQIALYLIIDIPNHSQRAPTKREVRSVRLKTSSNVSKPIS